ncbi:hypothetical protein OR16_33313 [Cupriavidus basilensis OR16]|uniref:Uncharacterized protein n=1 Tax=Cupriavidus basilensis OR16 TaxID=1127483 RepID=H1SED7_9BURK|nr:hypothetical protein [Cupriavidus basilensis]EHP39091.1 hypothetical protein OR16_33313 [Cupriavidus basilensis OR16]
MMEDLLPGSMAAPQAQALTSILAITRQEWHVSGPASLAVDCRRAGAKGQPAGPSHPRPRQRRRDQLAQRAARAFEAQVMALRCRQAFVLWG